MNRCRITGCSNTPAPQKRICTLHRTRIVRHGNPTQTHTPPDPIAIEAAVSTRRSLPGIRPAERRAAGIQLTALGLPAAEVARIFGVTERTVYRWRSRTPAA